MSHFKITGTLLVSMALIASLSGCGSPAAQTTEASPASSQVETEKGKQESTAETSTDDEQESTATDSSSNTDTGIEDDEDTVIKKTWGSQSESTIIPSEAFNGDHLWFLVRESNGQFGESKDVTLYQFNDNHEYRALDCGATVTGLKSLVTKSDSTIISACETHAKAFTGDEAAEWQPFDLTLSVDSDNEEEVKSEILILKNATEHLFPKVAKATADNVKLAGWYSATGSDKYDGTQAFLTPADTTVTEFELDDINGDVPVK